MWISDMSSWVTLTCEGSCRVHGENQRHITWFSLDYFMMHVSACSWCTCCADGKSQTLPTLSVHNPICLKKAETILFFSLFKFSETQMRMLFASSLFNLLSTKKKTCGCQNLQSSPRRDPTRYSWDSLGKLAQFYLSGESLATCVQPLQQRNTSFAPTAVLLCW